MPKLRNSDTDIGGFAQWIARKMRNHNPLAELKMERRQRAEVDNIYKAKKKGDLMIVADDESCIVYKVEGRVFRVDVREVTDVVEIEMLLDKEMVPVGY